MIAYLPCHPLYKKKISSCSTIEPELDIFDIELHIGIDPSIVSLSIIHSQAFCGIRSTQSAFSFLCDPSPVKPCLTSASPAFFSSSSVTRLLLFFFCHPPSSFSFIFSHYPNFSFRGNRNNRLHSDTLSTINHGVLPHLSSASSCRFLQRLLERRGKDQVNRWCFAKQWPVIWNSRCLVF